MAPPDDATPNGCVMLLLPRPRGGFLTGLCRWVKLVSSIVHTSCMCMAASAACILAAGLAIPKLLTSSQLGIQLASHLHTLSIEDSNKPVTSLMWAQICGLRSLRTLSMFIRTDIMPRMADIPEAISQMQQLNSLTLDVNDDGVIDVPLFSTFSVSATSALSSLTNLDLSGAEGSCLAAAGRMHRLQHMAWSRAGDAWPVPADMSGLTNLLSLSIDQCNIGGHVTALQGLQRRQELHCDANQSALAGPFFRTIGQLSSLTLIDMQDWHDLDTEEVQHLQGLSQLQHLHIICCGLAEFSASTCLTCLEHLDISHNRLTALPSMPSLPALTYLGLSHQSYTFQVPQACELLARLPALRELYLCQRDPPRHRWSADSLFSIASMQCKDRAAGPLQISLYED